MKQQTGAEMKQKTCRVIINADDFGQTESCTKAIYEAFESGLITDTTMVANGDAMELAFALASQMQGRVGVHLNLTEGTALTPEIQQNPKFVSHGRFTDYFKGRGTYFLRLSKKDRQDLYTELTAQVDRLMDEGIEISHVDSHHHIHCNWMLAPIIFRVCREHSIYRIRCTKMSQDDSDCGMGCTRGSTGFGSDGVVSDSQIILRAFGCTKNRLPAFRK